MSQPPELPEHLRKAMLAVGLGQDGWLSKSTLNELVKRNLIVAYPAKILEVDGRVAPVSVTRYRLNK